MYKESKGLDDNTAGAAAAVCVCVCVCVCTQVAWLTHANCAGALALQAASAGRDPVASVQELRLQQGNEAEPDQLAALFESWDTLAAFFSGGQAPDGQVCVRTCVLDIIDPECGLTAACSAGQAGHRSCGPAL